MSNQKEIERIKRIREQQIASRDPTKKEKQMQHNIAQKYRRVKSQEKPVKDSWDALSNIWKGMIFGAILGFILMMTVPFIVGGRIGGVLGLACLPIMIVLGVIIGSSLQWRKNMRNTMK
jgi:hypothetical protein